MHGKKYALSPDFISIVGAKLIVWRKHGEPLVMTRATVRSSRLFKRGENVEPGGSEDERNYKLEV